MKIIIIFFLLLLIIIGYIAVNYFIGNKDMPAECITQENLRKSFYNLKDSILKNGKEETLYEGYTHTVYAYDNINFAYRISGEKNSELEQIDISDKESGIFYWLLARDNEYSIGTKDYPKDIGKQKYEEVKSHFCNSVILNKTF